MKIKKSYNKSNIQKDLLKLFPEHKEENIGLAIDSILNTISVSLGMNKVIELRGFGVFRKKTIRPRKFINPKTKKISYLGETYAVNFKQTKAKY